MSKHTATLEVVRPSPTTIKFRPEVEGLRAVAILLVVLFHARVPGFDGGFIGVDIFFVISGFLITSHILREVQLSSRLNLLRFWGRRARRLLPAAATVLVVTAICSWAILPNTSWRTVGTDIAAASVYLANWQFAAEAVDYNAENSGASPVLHFWSLAVEEQFYILWPVLLGALALLSTRYGSNRRLLSRAGWLIVALILASFAWSIYLTSTNPSVAFFVTTTRIWELGVGALLAVASARLARIPRWAANWLGWLGAASIVFAAVVFNGATPWPGSNALLPVLGCAALIASTTGREVAQRTPASLLSTRTMVWIGGLSYSWYLWHWPVLVLSESYWGDLRLRYRIILVLGAGALAWLSLRYIENPVRQSQRLSRSTSLNLTLGANLSLLGLVAGLSLIALVPSSAQIQVDNSRVAVEGARVLKVDSQGNVIPIDGSFTAEAIYPTPADATRDLPQAQVEGCVAGTNEAEAIVCQYGDSAGEIEIALVGDSKILQWQPVISAIASEEGWRVRTLLKSACAFSEPSYELSDPQRESCATWNQAALENLVTDPPDVVITSGRQVYDGLSGDDPTPGAQRIASWWLELAGVGIKVLPLLDNPAPNFEVYECVAENPDSLRDCSFDRSEAVQRSGAKFQLLAGEISGVSEMLDFSDIACPAEDTCPPVIGNVLAYRQGSHLTNTFIESTIELIRPRLVAYIS